MKKDKIIVLENKQYTKSNIKESEEQFQKIDPRKKSALSNRRIVGTNNNKLKNNVCKNLLDDSSSVSNIYHRNHRSASIDIGILNTTE